MKIHPVGTTIHVKVNVKKDKTGIVVPDNVEKQEEEVVDVLGVGPDVTLTQPGERVIARHNSGQRSIVDGQDCVFIQESDVLAIIE